jgi:hypothetical protein
MKPKRVPKMHSFLISSVNAMTENRFERTYQEYKREKEQTRVTSRFDCLRSEPLRPPQIRESAGRFECLREDNYYSPVNYRENTKFECLVDEYYPRSEPVRVPTVYLPKPEPPVIYLPKPEPPVIYLPKPPKTDTVMPKPPLQQQLKPEPWRRGQAKKEPEVVGDINFHFPALGCVRGEVPKSTIKLPESRAPSEMIVKPIVVPTNKSVMTVLSFKGGKVTSKDVYEDGTDLPEDQAPVIIKRPAYTSWASVLRKDKGDVVYNTVEDT